jgi:hypothetical protein
VSVPRLAVLAALHAPSSFAFGIGLRQAIAGYQATFCVFLCDKEGTKVNAADVIAEGVFVCRFCLCVLFVCFVCVFC